MSGVYIKGMEMPKDCDSHWALDDSGDYPRCRITEEQRGYNFPIRKKRMGSCPLISVSPHGDLIDRKTAYDSLLDGMTMTGYQSRALDCISDFYVPTIIPEEEGYDV